MVRIALCDDSREMLDEVSQYINKYAEEKGMQNLDAVCFASAGALRNALDDGASFDVFLLDVYIGDELGTSLAKDIRGRGIEQPIVFITTSVEHAPESFESGTLRYLIKPLQAAKFYEAMDAALAKAKKVGERQIKLKTESGVESVNISRIFYSAAHAHYQYVTLDDGTQLRVRMTVTELYAKLAEYGGFVRAGSAYIINLRNIKNVSTAEVRMYNNFSIPIPRGKHTEIKRAFWDFQCDGQEE